MIEKIVDALGNETLYYYDSKGRVTKTVDCYGNYYINKYDIPIETPGYKSLHYFVAADNVANGSYDDADRENISETYYNIWGQATEKRRYKAYPDDYITEIYFYDIAGNLTKYIDANHNTDNDGYTNVYSYDGLNRLTTTKNAKGETTTAVYDAKGNVIKMYINEQEVFTKIYDEQGRLTSNVDALLKEQTYQYNTLGLLETSVDRNGTLFNYYYDELGNTTNSIAVNEYGCEFRNQIISPYGPSTVWDIFYYPTASGYSGSIYGKIDNAYSIGGKLMEKVASYDYSIGINDILKSYQGYLYDALGRVTLSAAGNFDSINQIIWGGVTHNEYNKTRIDKVQIDGQGTLNESDSVKVKYNFYPDGKLKSVIFPPLAGGLVLKSEYTYDGLGRLITLTNTKGSTVISAYSYAYDNNGNITTTTETINGEENTTIYGYDALNRIETVKSTKGNNDSYSYDFRGNRKANYEKTDLLTPENVSYSYDELNRLNNVNKDGSQTSFDYTADGYRFVKQTGNETTFYVYDKNGRLNAEVEVVTDGTTLFFYPIANYIWGPDRVLAKLDNLTGNRYYYIYNGHGDVVQILDTAGNIVNSYDYDIWGNFITKDETIHNPFTYFGQTYDESTGLYYLRARYYDPSVGRFISEDPIRDGANWYVYANNNPVNYVDPTGLDAIVITDDEAAGNFGHTSAIYQDADGNWFYTYWGNKAAAVIRIPDTYVKEYRRNGDISGNSMDSLADFNKSLNRFLSDNGFTDITSNYDQATYIVGDFTASLQAAYDDVNLAATNKHSKGDLRALDDGSKVFQGHNSPYNVAYRNCLDKTYASLSKGILANGMNAGTYMKDLGFNGGMRPDNAAPKFSQHFLNSSFTYDGAYSGALNYATLFVQKSPWAQVWAKANYANAIVGW